MIRVLNVISDSNIGGAGRVLLNYLRCADRERFEILTAVPRGSLLAQPIRDLGGTVYEVDGLKDRSYGREDVRALEKLIDETRPDIVHTHGALSGRIAAKRRDVRAIVMTKHCPAPRGNAAKRFVRRMIDERLTDAVIAVSEAVGRQMIASGTPRRLVHVVCNGILPQPDAAEDEREALRRRLGIDREHRWIGVAARLEPVKGVDRFLEMAALLCEREDLRFLVFGTGGEETALRAQAAPLGDAVRFAGFVNGIERSLALLDVTVVPSRSEAFCLSAAESLSMGTPVVAFDVDGVGEVVRDGETGLLVPEGDTAALATAVARLADDEALRRRLGENGRRLVRERFTAQAMARQIETIYEQVLAEKERKQ